MQTQKCHGTGYFEVVEYRKYSMAVANWSDPKGHWGLWDVNALESS